MVAFTNPEGPDWTGKAPDEYPVIEQASRLPTYSSLWFDPNGVDIHIAVTKDIDAAIAQLGQYVPRGVTVYFELAPYTQAELCKLRDRITGDFDKLSAVGIFVVEAGCGSKDPIVNIGMSPVTEETVAYMRERYDGPIEYHSDGVLPLSPVDPPTGEIVVTAITSADQAELSTCGQRPFPRSSLSNSPADLAPDAPEVAALHKAFDTYATVFGDLSALPWILAERDDFGATFLAPRGDTYLQEMVVAGRDGWIPSTLSECQPGPLSISSSDAWALDSGFPPPDATSTEIHVLLVEMNCASASSPVGRILPPLVSYDDASVTLTIAVRSLGGPSTCPSNPPTPVTVVLPEPLGGRELRGSSDLSPYQ